MADEQNPPAPPPIVLRYTGNGAYFPGFPACDLTETDIAASGHSIDALLNLGIFERVGAPLAAPEPALEPVVNTPPAEENAGNDDEVNNG